MSVHVFGLIDDAPVMEIEIGSEAGARAKILTWGAVLRDLVVPTPRGLQRVTLGLNTIDDYLKHSPSFGAVPGRFANRIANGRFTLDGVEHQLDRKPGEKHTLHGGPRGFGKRIWKLKRAHQRFGRTRSGVGRRRRGLSRRHERRLRLSFRGAFDAASGTDRHLR